MDRHGVVRGLHEDAPRAVLQRLRARERAARLAVPEGRPEPTRAAGAPEEPHALARVHLDEHAVEGPEGVAAPVEDHGGVPAHGEVELHSVGAGDGHADLQKT